MLNLLTVFSYKTFYLLAFYFNARILLHAEFINFFQLYKFEKYTQAVFVRSILQLYYI